MPFLLIIFTVLITSSCSSQLLYEVGQPDPSSCNHLLQAEREECLLAHEQRLDYEDYDKIRKEIKRPRSE